MGRDLGHGRGQPSRRSAPPAAGACGGPRGLPGPLAGRPLPGRHRTRGRPRARRRRRTVAFSRDAGCPAQPAQGAGVQGRIRSRPPPDAGHIRAPRGRFLRGQHPYQLQPAAAAGAQLRHEAQGAPGPVVPPGAGGVGEAALRPRHGLRPVRLHARAPRRACPGAVVRAAGRAGAAAADARQLGSGRRAAVAAGAGARLRADQAGHHGARQGPRAGVAGEAAVRGRPARRERGARNGLTREAFDKCTDIWDNPVNAGAKIIQAAHQPQAPLAGTVVVEMGHSVAAPFAGQVLADLGAEVIKIEKPEGDDARKWGPPFVDGAAATFQALNRNKKSVVSHLRDDADR
ncbi:MAG: hypothetical protein EOO24_46735, partial [Comamonadaceae bacterium]